MGDNYDEKSFKDMVKSMGVNREGSELLWQMMLSNHENGRRIEREVMGKEIDKLTEDLSITTEAIKIMDEEAEVDSADYGWTKCFAENSKMVMRNLAKAGFPAGIDFDHMCIRETHRGMVGEIWHNGKTSDEVKFHIGYLFESTDQTLNIDVLDAEVAAQLAHENKFVGTYSRTHPQAHLIGGAAGGMLVDY